MMLKLKNEIKVVGALILVLAIFSSSGIKASMLKYNAYEELGILYLQRKGASGKDQKAVIIDSGFFKGHELLRNVHPNSIHVITKKEINDETDQDHYASGNMHGTNTSTIFAFSAPKAQLQLLSLSMPKELSNTSEEKQRDIEGIVDALEMAAKSEAKIVSVSTAFYFRKDHGIPIDPTIEQKVIELIKTGKSLFYAAGNDGVAPEQDGHYRSVALMADRANALDSDGRKGFGKVYLIGNATLSSSHNIKMVGDSNRAGTSHCYFTGLGGAVRAGIPYKIEKDLGKEIQDMDEFCLEYCNQEMERYKVVSGTSMSTPMVAAGAALLFELFPNLTHWQLFEALKQSSIKKTRGVSLPPQDWGYGLVNLKKAYKYIREAFPGA